MAKTEDKTPKTEENTALIELYGTDDVEKIYENKTTGKQERAFSGKPKRVEISSKECEKLCKKVGLDFIDGYEARVIEYTITDETVDRYGDIVRANGVDFKTNYFPKNPTVQYAHNYGMLPVGKTIKIWKEDKTVKAWALFYDNTIDDTGMSNTVFKFVASNAMPAVSIGFLPLESKRPKTSEERSKVGLGEYGQEFTKVDLLEYSPCSIGANPNTLKNSLAESVKRGVFEKNDVENIKKIVPKDIFEEIKELIETPEPEENQDDDTTVKAIEEKIAGLEEKFTTLEEKLIEFIEKAEDIQEAIKQLNITIKPESPGTKEVPSEQESNDMYEKVLDVLDEPIKL